jgi:hypothetical protein
MGLTATLRNFAPVKGDTEFARSILPCPRPRQRIAESNFERFQWLATTFPSRSLPLTPALVARHPREARAGLARISEKQ